ncbi:MAG: OmpW family outer membrane protein [Sphingomonadales bacterium]
MFKKTPLIASAIIAFAGAAFVAPASAQDSPWQVRVRGIVVVPDESATIEAVGGDVNIDTQVVPELDISYFFTDNISTELILAVSPHDIGAVGTAAGSFPIGSTTLLPPSLTLQYHLPFDDVFVPYVGAGINYTFFLDEDPKGPVVNDINLDDSFGWVLQTGVDINVSEKWFLNLDMKKIWLDTDARIDTTLGTVNADVNIHPWIFGFGFGYRF